MIERSQIERIEQRLQSGELPLDFALKRAIMTRYAENHGGLLMASGTVAAVLGFSVIGAMGGIGIALIAAQYLLKWNANRRQDWEAIESGRYAHLLNAAEAKQYQRIYGQENYQAALQGDYAHAEPALQAAIDVPVVCIESNQPEQAEATAEPKNLMTVADDSPSSSSGETREPSIAATEPISTADYAWAKDLLHFPAVLIWGPQGSGKTSFAAWLLHQRIAAGHLAWVCDPHKEYGQWQGLKVVGAGMDYLDCDRAMLSFANTVKQAYKARSEQPSYKPTRETVLVEEFTNWSSRCENSADFFAAALSDLRKIKKSVIFVAHDRSLVALGNAKGFSKARNNGLLELQLEATIDPATGEPMPTLKGKLKYPGKAAIEVEISTEMNGSMNFTSGVTQPIQPQQDVRDRLENIFRTSDTSQPQPENLQTNEEISNAPGNQENQQESGFPAATEDEGNFHFEDFQLGKALFLAVKTEMENGKGKAAIVQEVLECPGRKYKYGCAWFDALMQKHGEP
jgi:hypothetical protein